MRFCETWVSVLDTTFLFFCSWNAFIGTVGQQPCSCSKSEDGGCVANQECDPSGNCNKVNVAYGKQANISSRHGGTVLHSGPGCVAVNGRTSTIMKYLEENDTNCVHSLADTDSENQWWQVDMAVNYTITNIIIYNRANQLRRITGIWIYVDNNICFQFPNSNDWNWKINPYLQEIVNITCQQPLLGRYLRLSKDGYSNYDNSFLNFCEVQVWVCKPGLFGPSCDQQCSGYCLNNATCDNFYGTCRAGCAVGYHGAGCFQTCGRCKNIVCDQVSGHCLDGCQVPGFAPPLCNPCSDTTYGVNCTQNCGSCANSAPCDKTDGHCDSCESNFALPLCQNCTDGYYGGRCSQSCGHCDDKVCDKTTGRCLQGCQAGYYPEDCQQACRDTTYGVNCTQSCGHCANSAACNKSDGRCDSCQGNFTLPLCQDCIDGYYGDRCNQPCGHCKDMFCDKTTGRCQHGCLAGYYPEDCQLECKNSTYGDNCAEPCGQCADQAPCDHITGHCDSCVDSYVMPLCKALMQSDKATGDGNNGAMIGGVVGAVVVVLAIAAILGIILYRRRRNNDRPGSSDSVKLSDKTLGKTNETGGNEGKPRIAAVQPIVHKVTDSDSKANDGPIYQNAQNSGSTHSFGTDFDEDEFGNSLDDRGDLYSNEEDVYSTFRASKPRLDGVQAYLVERLASGELRDEFKQIPKTNASEAQEVGNLKVNVRKNRFAQVIPYDRYRVVLTDGYNEGSATDYVNASYVSGCSSQQDYIASQGPRDNTLADFWRLIWQEKITHLVMLTNLIETGKAKCQQYWPEEEEGEVSYGPLTVSTTQVECRDSFYIRTLIVRRDGESVSRTVKQYHYVSWPDHGVPTTTSLVAFWRYVKNRRLKDPAPLLVHCSAGVGRTGTYIGLDIGMQMAVKDGNVNVPELVRRLRAERVIMVQAVEQYLFLHEALLEAYTARDTLLSLTSFDVTFPKPITSQHREDRIDKEFKALTEMQLLTSGIRHDIASQKGNLEKNRNLSVLPLDRHLVHLTESVQGRNQYINAVFMPTFRDPKGSILTQLPLPSTLVDFWRLVYGNNVTEIVSLCSSNEEKEVKPYCQYWPRELTDPVKSGPYTVTLHSKTTLLKTLTSYTLDLHKKDVTSPRTVTLLHYEGWIGEEGGDSSDMLKLLDTLVTSSMETNASKVVIQCSDGVGKSALFSALFNLVNHMTYDHEIDIYLTVRHVQTVIPAAVTSKAQYYYCYHIAQQRTREMNVYANV